MINAVKSLIHQGTTPENAHLIYYSYTMNKKEKFSEPNTQLNERADMPQPAEENAEMPQPKE